MNSILKTIEDVSERYSINTLASIASLMGGMFLILGKFGIVELCKTQVAFSILLFIISGTIIIVGWSNVCSKYSRLKKCAEEFHSINHAYRDCLGAILTKEQVTNNRSLLLLEQYTLEIVCQKIVRIFRNLINANCVVTVKLLTDDKKFCFAWARSERETERDMYGEELFEVGNNKNTGFDEALKFRPQKTSYFYSADLVKLAKKRKYQNHRDGWENLYKSTIIVPIRHVIDIRNSKINILGFLCVDTKSRNRLNDGFHVYYLAGFADQMYNFISIMRNKYAL